MSGTDIFYYFIPLTSIFQTEKWKHAPQIFHVLLLDKDVGVSHMTSISIEVSINFIT